MDDSWIAPSSSLVLVDVVVESIIPGGAEEEEVGSLFIGSSVGLLATGGSWGAASMVAKYAIAVFYILFVVEIRRCILG